jgi:GntR family histidine utilization transcriptional repressor
MDATGLKLDGEGPIWQQIRRAIAAPIREGALAPGDRVPSEHELMARFGASRMTVHKALASLAADGLVVRRRKSGTVVAARAPELTVFEIWDVAAQIEKAGAQHSANLVARSLGPADAEAAALLGVAEGAEVLSIVCLHRADGRPFQLEERLVNVAAVPEIRGESFAAVTPGRFLLDEVPWSEAQHTIRAVAADRRVARQLGLSTGDACLLVERLTWRGDEPVTFARLWHPGATHALVGRFSPGGRGG